LFQFGSKLTFSLWRRLKARTPLQLSSDCHFWGLA
jgi:hypothetical protein